MFDDNNCISFIYQLIQNRHQHTYIFKMQTGSRLIQNINGFTRIALRKFCCQLHALTLTTRQSSRRLSQLDISQSDFLQNLYLIQYLRNIFEKLYRTVDGHIKHIGDRFAFITHFQRFSVVALTVTNLARNKYIRKEIHFNRFIPISSTSLTTSSRNIE